MSDQSAMEEFAITNEKCKNCQSLLSVDHIDPDYEGPLATYENQKFCTLECITQSTEK